MFGVECTTREGRSQSKSYGTMPWKVFNRSKRQSILTHPLKVIEPNILQDFCREVITLKRMSHPNILELVGVMMNDQEWAMVSPWMANGDIMGYLKGHHQANPLKLASIAFRSL